MVAAQPGAGPSREVEVSSVNVEQWVEMFRAIGRMLRILPPAPVANDGKPAA